MKELVLLECCGFVWGFGLGSVYLGLLITTCFCWSLDSRVVCAVCFLFVGVFVGGCFVVVSRSSSLVFVCI